MRITNEAIRAMAMGRVMQDNTQRINSLDFTRDGELVVTASDDESVHLYNANTGMFKKNLYSKKYGIDLIRFTHHANAVVCASKNDWDQTLRYWSLHDNAYLRYFRGHRDRVVSLAMSPNDDTFISAALDNTARLWDLRTNVCQGLLRTLCPSCVSFDPQGLVFAATTVDNNIKLFDVRSYDQGPFLTVVVESAVPMKPNSWTGMKFSPDNKYILLSGKCDTIFLLDAFSGEKVGQFAGHRNSAGDIEASFTPDAQYVLSGSDDGSIHVWHTATGDRVAQWTGHAGPCRCVQWNPTRMMVASACQNLVFWKPTVEFQATQ